MQCRIKCNALFPRLLFDPKRRPTKIFKGSKDGSLDWFPLGHGTGCGNGGDDMVLLEHHLYNDGFSCREYNPLPGEGSDQPDTYDPCTPGSGIFTGDNENFPHNAAKLVRTRRFTGDAEPCESSYAENASSRDVRYFYDKRGRPVIQLEDAIGYAMSGGVGSLESPKFISATSTIYDNLDRPLIVATWPDFNEVPTVEGVEFWAGLLGEYSADEIAVRHLIVGPVTLHQTLYDERGRPYEQRRYNVDDATGGTYEFTRTYRDDLDRVVAELGPTGLTVNKYDSLGRTIETSWWSKEKQNEPGKPDGVELTRSRTLYDAFGNVLKTTHYDRKDTTESGAITDANSIRTFTYNWYDKARRLAATANFGTNGDHFFHNGDDPALENEENWQQSPPAWDGDQYSINSAPSGALITRFGYDRAGRRIWTQDPKGVVTRTWHDLLGNVLLVAENWNDDEELAPDTVDPADSLTPGHEGPIRYTAYHYTRGGLQDAIVAINIPPGAAQPQLTPASFQWNDDDQLTDFAAGTITVAGLANTDYQVTRLRYEDNIVVEALTSVSNNSPTISKFPNMVSRVEYPDNSTLNFRYTIDGKLARRTDSRNVSLTYSYGTDENDDGKMLSAVTASLPGPSAYLDGTITSLRFRHNHGLLLSASSLYSTGQLSNRVDFEYDGFQNLLQETLAPFGNEDEARSTQYVWSNTGVNTNRLEQIVYPSGSRFRYDYGSAASSSEAEDAIKRMTGLTEVYAPNPQNPLTVDPIRNIARNEYTGGGRKQKQIWGEAASSQDTIASLNLLPDQNGASGIDRFGRPTDLRFHVFGSANPTYQYQYGYDSQGNVAWNRISQPGNVNTRSYLYRYDPLGRLILAERGELAASNLEFTTTMTTGWNWTMDSLGNWTGQDGESPGLMNFSSSDPEPGFGNGDLTAAESTQVLTNGNQIDQINHPNGNYQGIVYDNAGNLAKDDAINSGGTYAPLDHEYKFDAWNRLTQAKRRHALTGTSAPGIPFVAKYTYDALGRRIIKKVMASSLLNTDAQGDLLYYDGNRIIEQYAFVENTSGGGGDNCADANCGGGGGGPGGPYKAREPNPALGLRGRMRAEAELRRDIEAARAAGDNTPEALLRLMRPDVDWTERSDEPQGDERSGTELGDSVVLVKSNPAAENSFAADNSAHNPPQQTQIAKDQVYESKKSGNEVANPSDAEIDDPKIAVRQSGSGGQYELFRTIVHGLDYVNELVLMADQITSYYPLQDANYNVIALIDDSAFENLMCEYDPYGRMRFRGENYVTDWTDSEFNPTLSAWFYDLPGFQGGMQDRETGLICFGARCSDPDLGRWIQQDPNGTGLVLISGMRYHGQRPSALTWAHSPSQFADGLNLFAFVGGDPINSRDPSGLFSYSELASTMGTQSALGGLISGTVSKFAGKGFWEGFAEGAVSGAMGGGFAFAASRFGFVGRVVFSNFAEEVVESTGRAAIKGDDLTDALMQGAFDGAVNMATGGVLGFGASKFGNQGIRAAFTSMAGRHFDAFEPFIGRLPFRRNLARLWGMAEAPAGYHAHHVFPVEFEDKFRSIGINPHNPLLGAWWEADDHLDNARAYNGFWKKFFDDRMGRTIDPEEVLDEGRKLAQKYGLSITF